MTDFCQHVNKTSLFLTLLKFNVAIRRFISTFRSYLIVDKCIEVDAHLVSHTLNASTDSWFRKVESKNVQKYFVSIKIVLFVLLNLYIYTITFSQRRTKTDVSRASSSQKKNDDDDEKEKEAQRFRNLFRPLSFQENMKRDIQFTQMYKLFRFTLNIRKSIQHPV